MKRVELSKETIEILNFLANGGKNGYFWTSGDAGKLTSWYPAGLVRGYPQNWADNQWNIYFGVNPVMEDKSNLERAKLEDIGLINCLFAEFDAKAYGSKPEIRDHISNLVNSGYPSPSLIVDSGGGYHCYWFLNKTCFLNEKNRNEVKCKLYAWIDAVGGDPASKDLCRVLRLPGTKNYKPQYETDEGFPEVTIEEYDINAQYELAALMELIQFDPASVCADPVREVFTVNEPIDDKRLQAYCNAGLENEISSLQEAAEGTRNHKLFIASCNVAELVARGGIAEDYAREQLASTARSIGLSDGEARATINSGFAHGLQSPREIKHTDDYLNEQAYLSNDAGDPGFYTFHYPKGIFGKQKAVPQKDKPKQASDTIFPEWLEVNPNDVRLEELNKFQVSDEGNAQALTYIYPGRFSYNSAFKWLYYDGHKWASEGASQYIDRAATNTLIWRQKAALLSESLTPRMFPSNHKNVGGLIAQLESIVYVPVSRFDQKSGYLNTLSGLINLRTGEVTQSSPSNYLTHCVELEYKPDADMSFFKEWLIDACNLEQARWLQLMCGHALMGSPVEESLVYIVGPSRSGKGTFTETIQAVLASPLSKEINFSTFIERRDSDAQNFDLAMLVGSRFIFATESKEHEKINGAKLKAITGGSEIMCSHKHKDPFTYRPRFTIFLSSNFMPNISSDDEAAWGRVRMITFPHSHLGQEDKELKIKMRSKANMEAVLLWLVQGAIDYCALGNAGLVELESSKRAKDAQSNLLDNVAAWLDEAVAITGSDADFVSFTDCMKSYQEWCKANAVQSKTQNGLARSLEKKRLTYDPAKTFVQCTKSILRPGGTRSTTRGYKGMVIP